MYNLRMIKYFRKIPELICDRLILRKIKLSDAEDMYEYSSDVTLTEYLLWSPHPFSLREILSLL